MAVAATRCEFLGETRPANGGQCDFVRRTRAGRDLVGLSVALAHASDDVDDGDVYDQMEVDRNLEVVEVEAFPKISNEVVGDDDVVEVVVF